MLRGVTTKSGSGGCPTVPTAHSPVGGGDEPLDELRTGMILNNTAVRRKGIVYD